MGIIIIFIIVILFAIITLGVFHGVCIGLKRLPSHLGERTASHLSLLITILSLYGFIGFGILSPDHPDSDVQLYIALFAVIVVPSVLWWFIQILRSRKKKETADDRQRHGERID